MITTFATWAELEEWTSRQPSAKRGEVRRDPLTNQISYYYPFDPDLINQTITILKRMETIDNPQEGQIIEFERTAQQVPQNLIGAYLRNGYGITPTIGQYVNLVMYQSSDAENPKRYILTDGAASQIDTPEEEQLQKAVYFNTQFFLVKLSGRQYPEKTPDLHEND